MNNSKENILLVYIYMFAFIDMKGLNMLRDDCFLERRKKLSCVCATIKTIHFLQQRISIYDII